MPIFIAKEYNGEIVDVILAKNTELAMAYWHGKNVFPHSTSELSELSLKDHPTGVIPIVTTELRPSYELDTPGKKYRLIKKG